MGFYVIKKPCSSSKYIHELLTKRHDRDKTKHQNTYVGDELQIQTMNKTVCLSSYCRAVRVESGVFSLLPLMLLIFLALHPHK